MSDQRDLLTVRETAARLHVSIRTLRRWLDAGIIGYIRVRHTVRIYWPLIAPRRDSE